MARTARGLLHASPTDRSRGRFRLMDASSEPTSTVYLRMIGNALPGFNALQEVRQLFAMMHWLMKRWIGSRPISRPTLTSIACSTCRDESGSQQGNESDQDAISTTVKPERGSNVRRFCRTATITQNGVVEVDAVIGARTSQRKTKGTCHCRFRITRVRRTVMTSVTAHSAPCPWCRSPFRYGGRSDYKQSREPRRR